MNWARSVPSFWTMESSESTQSSVSVGSRSGSWRLKSPYWSNIAVECRAQPALGGTAVRTRSGYGPEAAEFGVGRCGLGLSGRSRRRPLPLRTIISRAYTWSGDHSMETRSARSILVRPKGAVTQAARADSWTVGCKPRLRPKRLRAGHRTAWEVATPPAPGRHRTMHEPGS